MNTGIGESSTNYMNQSTGIKYNFVDEEIEKQIVSYVQANRGITITEVSRLFNVPIVKIRRMIRQDGKL